MARPNLRTIQYTESAVSEGMNLLMNLAYAINEKSKDRFEARSAQSQKEQFAKDMAVLSQGHAETMFQKKKDFDLELYDKKRKLDDLQELNIMMFKGAERNKDIELAKKERLEEAIRKFNVSPSDLYKTNEFPKLSSDVATTYAGNAAIINRNVEQYKAFNKTLQASLDDLSRQGAVLDREILAFAGKNQILQSDEYWGTGDYKGRGFIDWAMTSDNVDFTMPDGKTVRKGLGWGNHYGADWAFRKKGDPSQIEILAAERTTLMTSKLKEYMTGESVILKTMFTPLTDSGEKDTDDVIDRIENRLKIKFTEKEKTEFQILNDVLVGTLNPSEVTRRILEYSSDESNKYNLDALLEKAAPEAWRGLKNHHNQVLRIESDELDSGFIDDPHEAFRTASENMTTAGDMFTLFHQRTIGMSEGAQVKIWDEIVEPRLIANGAKSKTGDFGKDFDIWLEERGLLQIIDVGGDEYAKQKAQIEVKKKGEKLPGVGYRLKEDSRKAYLNLKDEMDRAGEHNLQDNLKEYNYHYLPTGGQMRFNSDMLSDPDNLAYIKKEALASIERFAQGGWSLTEGFHTADDAQEVLDLLIKFEQVTTGKTQKEAENEYSQAIKSLAKFK